MIRFNEAEYLVHSIFIRLVAVKAGQIYAVGDGFDGVETVYGVDASQDSGITYYTAKFYAFQSILQRFGVHKIQRFCRPCEGHSRRIPGVKYRWLPI